MSGGGGAYIVFNQCNVDGSAIAGTTYLGRPWGDYARVTFQKSTLGSVVASAGWIIWATGDERTSHVAYSEYGNTGAGAASSGKRVCAFFLRIREFAYPLHSPHTHT